MPIQILETNGVRIYKTHKSETASRTASAKIGPKTIIDRFTILPILACFFSLILEPILISSGGAEALKAGEARVETRFFWPAMAGVAVLMAAQNSHRLKFPPHIKFLFAYLALAGASILWAFAPQSSFVRFLQQTMIVVSIVVPILLAPKTVDILRSLFLCFSFALILNLIWVYGGAVTLVYYGAKLVNIGYEGYFNGKNYLGECAAVAFLLSFHEIFRWRWRGVFGVLVASIAILLVILSDSKTALGLALICPPLAWLTLLARKTTHISAAVFLLTIPVFFMLFSAVTHTSLFSRISYILYHDSTLTGRTIIWTFAESEIALRPFLGWGYQSFWLVPGSPSLGAPGWVKMMPNAHNGYYDTMLETGYLGLALLLAFIVATLHAAGRDADRDPPRAQLLLSLILFIILYNFFESLWVRGFEFLWVTFIIAAAEIGRYGWPSRARKAEYTSGGERPGGPSSLPGMRMIRPSRGLS